MQKIVIRTRTQNYPVYIGAGVLTDPQTIFEGNLTKEAFVVTNQTVMALYGKAFAEKLTRLGVRVVCHILPDGEEFKTIEYCNQVITHGLQEKLSRHALLITLGGGVVGDLAGFAAAIYLRGIPYIHIPTTLLAQVDASIGGKVGVNHPLGKNLIGSFYHPQAVFSDVLTLRSLPKREYLAGFAEVLKHGFIADRDYLDFIMTNRDKLLDQRDPELMIEVVAGSVRIKGEIVSDDEYEHNKRMVLNFGHTFAHGIEQATGYTRFLHGEAVALGMVAAGFLGTKLGLFSLQEFEEFTKILNLWGLPTSAGGLSFEQVYQAMMRDKKTRDQKLTFIVPRSIGRVQTVQGLDKELIILAIKYITQGANP